MTKKIEKSIQMRRVMEAMKRGSKEKSALEIGKKTKMTSARIGELLGELMKCGYVEKRKLEKYEKRKYGNGMTTFLWRGTEKVFV